jgi:hypothetical protein
MLKEVEGILRTSCVHTFTTFVFEAFALLWVSVHTHYVSILPSFFFLLATPSFHLVPSPPLRPPFSFTFSAHVPYNHYRLLFPTPSRFDLSCPSISPPSSSGNIVGNCMVAAIPGSFMPILAGRLYDSMGSYAAAQVRQRDVCFVLP